MQEIPNALNSFLWTYEIPMSSTSFIFRAALFLNYMQLHIQKLYSVWRACSETTKNFGNSKQWKTENIWFFISCKIKIDWMRNKIILIFHFFSTKFRRSGYLKCEVWLNHVQYDSTQLFRIWKSHKNSAGESSLLFIS